MGQITHSHHHASEHRLSPRLITDNYYHMNSDHINDTIDVHPCLCLIDAQIAALTATPASGAGDGRFRADREDVRFPALRRGRPGYRYFCEGHFRCLHTGNIIVHTDNTTYPHLVAEGRDDHVVFVCVCLYAFLIVSNTTRETRSDHDHTCNANGTVVWRGHAPADQRVL